MGELVLLTEGRLELLGLIRESSNSALLVEVTLEEETAWGIYKPLEGERPLLDFRPGLHRRERAAYVLSEFLGWGIVPPTVLRQDGPFGTGSLQRFVEHDPRQHYFTLYDTAPDTQQRAHVSRAEQLPTAERRRLATRLTDVGVSPGPADPSRAPRPLTH